MPMQSARVSIDVVWRSTPARFVVRFYDGTLVLREDGNKLVADAWLPKDSSERRLGRDAHPWRFTPEHSNFVDCMMMAAPEAERLARAP